MITITIDPVILWSVAGLLFAGVCLIGYGVSKILEPTVAEPPGQCGERN